MSKYCANCGAELTEEAVFCGGCGAQINLATADRVEVTEPKKEPESILSDAATSYIDKKFSGGKPFVEKSKQTMTFEKKTILQVSAGVFAVIALLIAVMVTSNKPKSSTEQANSSETASGETTAETNETETVAINLDLISAENIHTVTLTDRSGYKEAVTINISDWIKGSETDLINAAWANVGGEGQLPLDGTVNTSAWGDVEIIPETSIYLFGNITVEYLTTDFPASNYNGGNNFITISLQNCSLASNLAFIATEYSTETTVDELVSSFATIRPAMTSNEWGPVPIVICISNYFNPNNPNGNTEAFDQVYLDIQGSYVTEGDGKFKPGITW